MEFLPLFHPPSKILVQLHFSRDYKLSATLIHFIHMLMTIDHNSDFDWDLANLSHGLTHNMIGKQFLYFTQSEKLVWLYELARDINKGVPVLGAK